MSFADSATTQIANSQATAVANLVTVMDVLNQLVGMLEDTNIPSVSTPQIFFAGQEVPKFDVASLTADLVAKLKNIDEDTKALMESFTADSTEALRRVNEFKRELYLEIPDKLIDTYNNELHQVTAPSLREVSSAKAVKTAVRHRLTLERRDAEAAVLSKISSAGFAAPPGLVSKEFLSIRTKAAEALGTELSRITMSEFQTNAQLWIQYQQLLFNTASEITTAWVDVVKFEAQLIADLFYEYEPTPLLTAERRVAAASAMTGAFSQLNQAVQSMARTQADSTKLQLAATELQAVNAELKALAYRANVGAALGSRSNIAGALAQVMADTGRIAYAAISSISTSGSFTERGFA